uniref:Uncharacterized protein n=1 Tax=uncultured marine group II/III euryarchaeote KM3_87_G11 TaxID=1456534 RepID=A0A075HWA1_9EURY|nr:hypothetical protein [uncultured marine group II/III euryarchaeote KM3_87_G11]
MISLLLSVWPPLRSLICSRYLVLPMNRTQEGKESIQATDEVEVISRTPLASLRTTGSATVTTSHGLVRLASSTGRVESPDWKPTDMTTTRPDWRTHWRTLRARGRTTRTNEVVG